MTLDQKLKQRRYKEIWQEYCGFLDISLDEYMGIQNRLLLEQLRLYADCELGRLILKGTKPTTVDEFRRTIPLTTYADYADILLKKNEAALPAKPAIWIETTWEGGKSPIKTAPYTQSMVDNHKGTILSIIILSTSDGRGRFTLRSHDNFLFGLAPLPYFSGLVPYAMQGELSVNFMPPVDDAIQMSFGERNKEGFVLGMQKGIDVLIGMSSVITRISESFAHSGDGNSKKRFMKNLFKNSPVMNYRMLKAMMRSKEDGVPITPKDIWRPKGLVCGGTDSAAFKKRIENLWGIRPLELFGGTEPTCIGTEIWSKDGLVFFPDVCFYEFIPEQEFERNLQDPSYEPKAYLINELVAGSNYELVISNFKGGAFMRYRVGDVFRCLSLANEIDGIGYPQFAYIDRISTVIDIAGFTRITENTITEAIRISNLNVHNWFALKEYGETNRPYVHLYVEMGVDAIVNGVVAKDIIQNHLSIYFRYLDGDYQDLKHMLGIDPLMVSVLPTGVIERYSRESGKKIRKMNPSHYDVTEIVKLANR